MVSIGRINTKGDNTNQLSLTIDGVTKSITKDDIARLNSPTKWKERLEKLFGFPLPDVHIHKNRGNNGFVIATGQEPDIWPEDEP